MSAFREAVRRQLGVEIVICPKCAAQDIPGAKPTLERESDGTMNCAQCGHTWKPENA